jgi:hypothetical protein
MHHTPDCFDADGYFTPTVCVFSQVVCGFAAMMYAVLVANVWDARRCRRANAAALALIEDSELVEKWGQLQPSATMQFCGGLLAREFGNLPRHAVNEEGQQCSICLAALQEGESARSLPGCGHVFHRCCIDLWLLRQTICPLCKTDVRFVLS